MKPMSARRVEKDIPKPEMNYGYAFFKCITTSEKMEIPRAVVCHIQGALRNRVMLRDRYKNEWPMEVGRNGDKWSFKKGWPQFYQEVYLKTYDFLVFEYKGNNLFDFKLLGEDGCEKKGVGAPKFKVKVEAEEYKDEEEDDDLNEESEGNSSDDDDDDEDDEDYMPEGESDKQKQVSNLKKTKNKSKFSRTCNRNLSRLDTFAVGTSRVKRRYNKKNVSGKKGIQAPIREVEDNEKENKDLADSGESDESNGYDSDMQMEHGYSEEEELVKVAKVIKPKSKPTSSRALTRKMIRPNSKSTSSRALIKSLSSKDRTFGNGTIPGKRSYKKKNVPDCYGADIFKSGLTIRPQNPYFVSRTRSPRKNELYIPKAVIEDYHLHIPTKLFLVDKRGNRWETTIKRWNDGRLRCTGGWKSFCNVNNINVDDTCICEFVQKEGCKDLCIVVRVVDGAGRQTSS